MILFRLKSWNPAHILATPKLNFFVEFCLELVIYIHLAPQLLQLNNQLLLTQIKLDTILTMNYNSLIHSSIRQMVFEPMLCTGYRGMWTSPANTDINPCRTFIKFTLATDIQCCDSEPPPALNQLFLILRLVSDVKHLKIKKTEKFMI